METENLINITFTDVMKIIASEETSSNDKTVYIYLLNIIMDMSEKVDRLEAVVSDLTELFDDCEE